LKTFGITRTPAIALGVVGLGASIGPLDFAVAVAFPAITAAFGLETSDTRWVAVWYVMSYGSLMLVFGALGDRIGHLRVFRLGLVLSAVAYVLCALAPSYHWLLATRVLQGVAVALTLSCGPALAIAQFDDSRRTHALSRYAAMAALAGVVAPIIGGQSIALLGWPGVYWFRVPIVLLALACLPLLGPVIERARAHAPVPFDLRGSLLLAGGVALFLLLPALVHGGQSGLLALPVTLFGFILMARFVRRQRASATPFLPHAVVGDAGFIVANLSSVAVQFASFAVPLLVPYYLKRIATCGPLAIGVLLAIWAIGSLAGSSIAARLVSASGARGTALHAGLLVMFGLIGIACWPATPSYPLMIIFLLLQGIGIGLYQVAYADIVVAALPPSARGVAGSLTMVTRTVGIVIGASAWMGTLQALEYAGVRDGVMANDAFVAAFRHVLQAAAAVAGLFFACTYRRWRA
jgi:MFS family permease